MVEATIGMSYLYHAIADGHAEITGEGRTQRIHYIDADHSERYSDPEEKVRAELWAELIYKYEYPARRIDFEVNVPRRTPNDYADLVIYEDDELKSPYMVFECKRVDISDAAFDQSIEQACGNRASLGAKYCGAVAGLTRRLLRFDDFPPGERDKNHLTDIPKRYGQPPAWRFLKNTPGRDLAAVSRDELRAAIRKCHQTLWEGGKRSPIVAFGEFCKLVFIKHRDEKNLGRKNGENYDFQKKGGETASDLAARINRLYDKERRLEPDVFTEPIIVEPAILTQCVEHLEGISLDRTELDTKGVAFEEFMGGFFKGDFGQYFTPRDLIAFCVEVLQPKRTDFVLDPACGSGGFLLHALDYVRREADQLYAPDSVDHFRYWHDFAQNNLFGIEINDELTRVAKMNMIIHDDGHTNIVGHDALDFTDNLRQKNPGVSSGKFDLVLTNPPFGAVIRRTEKGDGYLEQFQLMRYLVKDYPLHTDMTGEGEETDTRLAPKSVKPRASVKTEIVFLERIHSFLKPGTGRAAVVLPDGVLTNSSLKGVRHWILNHFQLLGVVSLPQLAFSHYDAGVKASIVFLRRLRENETPGDNEAIFMALAENIGYDSTGRKTFSVTSEQEEAGVQKVERHSCDLFDYRVFYDTKQENSEESGWSEHRREIIPGTGLVGLWGDFQKNLTPFVTATEAINLPQTIDSVAFATRRRTLGPRFDPYFHSPAFAGVYDLLAQMRCERLGDIATFSNETWDPSEHEGTMFRYIEISRVDPKTGSADWTDVPVQGAPSRARMQVRSDDIIISLTRPHHGSIAHLGPEFEGCVASTGFAVLRGVAEHVRRDYLWCALRMEPCLSQMLQRSSGGNYPAITEAELRNVLIPMPDVETQAVVASETMSRYEQARRLRVEADTISEEARLWLEEQLLGPAGR